MSVEQIEKIRRIDRKELDALSQRIDQQDSRMNALAQRLRALDGMDEYARSGTSSVDPRFLHGDQRPHS